MTTGKQKLKKILLIIPLLAGMLAFQLPSRAGYVNAGTLDVQPLNTESGYITKYLAPGGSASEIIRVSNFSPYQKQLYIYPTETSNTENGNYFTKKPGESITGIGGWIELPVEKFTLGPAESAEIKVNISAPENAGVGLHTGAVIVREIPSDSETGPVSFSMEKGVRVYLNVTGPVINNAVLENVRVTETGGAISYNLQIRNLGTVIDSRNFTALTKDMFGNTINESTLTAETRPGETEISVLEIPKPRTGIYNFTLTDENGTVMTSTAAVIPLWMLLSLALGLILFASWAGKTNYCPYKIAERLHYEKLFKQIYRGCKSLEIQRSFAYLGLAAIIFTTTFSQININPEDLKTQVLPADQCAFDMTVKWGAMRGVEYPEDRTQKWHGKISIPNSKISIVEYLHFETGDQAELDKNKKTLSFNLETGPDNDGIIIRVEPQKKEYPYIYYTNDLTGETQEFEIKEHISSAGIYPSGLGGTYFKSELCGNTKLMMDLISKSAMGNGFLMEELDATPEAAAPPAGAAVPELDNLFMEELPATPEALSDFIMKSNYVQKTSRIDSTRKIETDNILIKALEATPDILEEIAATPDLNFIFIPGDTIVFPPMTFSFSQERVIRQPMGTIIFVQNKEDSWNAFVGTSDFQLLSGDLRIPASALSIDPGEPVILGKYKIKEPAEEIPAEETPAPATEMLPAEEPLLEEPPVIDFVDVPLEIPATESLPTDIIPAEEDLTEQPPETPTEEVPGGEFIETGEPEEPAVETTDGSAEEEPAAESAAETTDETTMPAAEDTAPEPVSEPTVPVSEEPAAEPATPPSSEEPAAEASVRGYLAFFNIFFNIFDLFDSPVAFAAPPSGLPDKARGSSGENTNPAEFLANPSTQNKIDAQSRRLEITPESLEKIKAGDARSFAGRFDKATLVNVDPTPGEKVIFMLRPTLEIRIPAGMPAGTYQGELTITSL